jgi:hypothetical protein
VRVSGLFLRVLAEACRHQAATGGLFSPFLGADLARLGYARDFAAGPLHEDPGPAPAGSVRLDPGASTVELPPGLRVDLGGFVKGWSVQAAARAVSLSGRNRLNTRSTSRNQPSTAAASRGGSTTSTSVPISRSRMPRTVRSPACTW